MASKKLILGIVGVLILGAAVVAGVFLIKQNQDLREKAAPATSLYITPATQTKNAGDTFSFSVNMDTNENSVTGIDVKVNFDPSALEITSMQKGGGISAFDTIITNTYDNNAGTVSYVIFTLDKTKAAKGSGVEVLKVNGKVKSGVLAGNYNLTFDPSTSASASQEGQNVLVSKTGAKITVGGSGGPTANPTATATSQAGNPTATATAHATATSTSHATATATAKASATATAKATATATSQAGNPTATATATATSQAGNPTATATVTASPFPVPETGMSLPTVMAAGLGLVILIVSVSLAL